MASIRSPAAKVQALRGARLRALLALDFCLFQRGSSCKPDSQYATTDMSRSTQGFPPDPRTILWTDVGHEKRKRMAGKTVILVRAREQSRTATPVTALPPESSASTNFATRASEWTANIRNVL